MSQNSKLFRTSGLVFGSLGVGALGLFGLNNLVEEKRFERSRIDEATAVTQAAAKDEAMYYHKNISPSVRETKSLCEMRTGTDCTSVRDILKFTKHLDKCRVERDSVLKSQDIVNTFYELKQYDTGIITVPDIFDIKDYITFNWALDLWLDNKEMDTHLKTEVLFNKHASQEHRDDVKRFREAYLGRH